MSRINTNLARKRAYRGFSSSISNLFEDERVTCSAVACFGVLASMKTEFLLRQAHPVRGTARRERPQSVVISIVLLVTIVLFSLTYVLIPDNGYSSRVTNHNTNSFIFNDQQHRTLMKISTRYQILSRLYESYNQVYGNSFNVESRESGHLDRVLEQAANYQDEQEKSYYDDNTYNNKYGYDDNYDDDYTFEWNDFSNGFKVRTFLVVTFLIIFGTVGRRRRSRTRYFMIKAKLYDDRLYGRDLPMVALSQTHSKVSEIAMSLSGEGQIQDQLSRDEFKQWTTEIAKCEELPSEAGTAHALCGCYPTDTAAHNYRSKKSSLPTVFDEEEEDDITRDNECKFLYRKLSKWFCGKWCNRWVQCLGMCALAQEARETKLLVPKLAQRLDYLTHQPWYEYESQMQQLRQNQVTSFKAHMKIISKLSRYILLSSMWSVLLTVLTVYLTVENFGYGNASVLFFTFGISFLVIYVVQWHHHRFTLSLDAVIKLFAAGFVLAVPTAYIVEGILQTIILCFSLALYLVLSLFRLTFLLNGFMSYALLIFGELINAFIIAAVTEELTKYLVYRCVEHPDLMLWSDYVDENEEMITVTPSDANTNNINQKLTISRDERTNVTRAASITIAMVTVAVGLACAENVVYVYLAGGSRVQEEIIVLLARSIFPIHAMCAAIQSIGVVLRDIERRSEYHLGKIVLPAILLHGGFDAILMIMGVLEEQDNENEWYGADIVAWCSIFIILGASITWYRRESRAQMERLRQLDEQELRTANDSNAFC